MTKIKEILVKKYMHSHTTKKSVNKKVEDKIDLAYKAIKDRLPPTYVERVFSKITDDKTLTAGIIRNVKYRATKYPILRINVLIALVEIANEYQTELSANLKKIEKHTA